MSRFIRTSALATLLCTAILNPASAQLGVPRPVYRPPYPVNPYNPYLNPYNTYGNAVQGAATMVDAYSNVPVQQQQARLLYEQANQSRLDTKKKAFDQMLYENAHTPSYADTAARDQALRLTRLMNNPIPGEIANGTTLNAMLPLLQDLASRGTQGPPVPIAQSLVNQLNIAGSGGSSVGMLRAGGTVDWPVSLRGPQQKKLDKLLPQASEAALAGTLDSNLMRQVRKEMKDMREGLREQLHKDEIEASSYMRAIEFYNSLEPSVNALERPDARKQLAGAYSPRARNVQELVDFMTDNGVKFAGASPGNENAYQATHDAFVRYVRTAQSSGGLHAMHAPLTPAPSKQR